MPPCVKKVLINFGAMAKPRHISILDGLEYYHCYVGEFQLDNITQIFRLGVHQSHYRLLRWSKQERLKAKKTVKIQFLYSSYCTQQRVIAFVFQFQVFPLQVLPLGCRQPIGYLVVRQN